MRTTSGGDAPPKAGHPSFFQRWQYMGLFLVIALVYLCTLTDVDFYRIIDGQIMFDTAVSIHEFGELGISPEFDGHGGRAGVSDHYGKYGLGLSLVEQIPLALVPWVEKTFGEGSSNLLLAMTNLWLTALTALLVALCLRELEFHFWTGALAAIAFALGTYAWPYISYDFSEPLQEFCLILGFWLLLRGVQSSRRSLAALGFSGFMLGLAVLTKANLLLMIPCYAAYLWFLSPLPERRRNLGWWAGPVLLWGVAIAFVNYHRFGSIFDMGYGRESADFTNPLFAGLFSLLIGPNKGLIFYAPLTLLFPWACWKFSRKHRREAIFFVSLFVLQTLVNAKWWSWEGGESWGTRMLLPVLPFLIVCVTTLLEDVKWSIVPFSLLLIAGFAVNLLGLLVFFQVWPVVVKLNNQRIALDVRGRPADEYVIQDGKKWFLPSIATYYLPALSPLRGNSWLLRERLQGEFQSSLERLNEPPSLSSIMNFPPVEINFSLLKDPFFLEQLRSPHFWIWDKITHAQRSEVLTYPVYAIALQHQGDRAVSLRNIPRAVYCFSRAADLMPDNVGPVLRLSEVQAHWGDIKGAEGSLKRFLSSLQNDPTQDNVAIRRPQEIVAHARLGQLYELSGSPRAAEEEYRAVLALGPADRDRSLIENRLQKLSAVP